MLLDVQRREVVACDEGVSWGLGVDSKEGKRVMMMAFVDLMKICIV
jgi:hypothetical protein